MEPLSLKPREKEELFRDGEGMDRDFEGDGGSSKEDLEINLDNQIREGYLFLSVMRVCVCLIMEVPKPVWECVVTPSNKTNHIDIVGQNNTAIDDDVSVETNLLDSFLETFVGRDAAASAKALVLLEANSGIEVCPTLFKKWKQLRPLTQKFIALIAELKKTNEHLTINGLNRAEKEVKVLDEENDASEESSDTLIRPYKKKKHTPVSGGKASSTKAVGIDFQEEILRDILSRLPVLPLLRFKCVSKFWKTLISDPYFNMKHQRHHENDLNSQKLLVALDMDSFFSSSSLSTVQLVDDVQNLDYPSNFEPVDSCSIYEFAPGNTTFILGYDATSGDYKIFKPDRGSDDIDLPPSYEILALKSGSWRKIRNYPTRVCPRTGYTLEICPKFDEDNNTEPLAFLHGAFHWLGFSHRQYSMVSFSSSSDNVFRETSIPELPKYRTNNTWKFFYGVSVLVGMLCVYSTHYNLQMEGNFKLWVKKDYSVEESWTEILLYKTSIFVQSYQNIDLQMVNCYSAADRMVVLYLGHPEDHLDYGLKLISIKTGSFIQKA
ncbi:hypothetical protein HAX54_031550 [Datura stramonium]|uniref:F-box domain-containing protein n=1 Tax=Datura stramonium TaxID=4076 RepID=A0ABS8RGT4_DATST|nr:hypothetical protein [Datura stramonium]